MQVFIYGLPKVPDYDSFVRTSTICPENWNAARAWSDELMAQEELFLSFHDHLPAEMIYERQLLIGR
jgi:phosphoenolpyruvate carboxykinase (GTP)